jgi:hypothetical protein
MPEYTHPRAVCQGGGALLYFAELTIILIYSLSEFPLGGIMPKPKAELSIGQKFGKLLVVEVVEERATDGRKKVRCLCDCGQETIKIFSLLSQSKTISCGCAISENATKQITAVHQKMIDSGKWNKDPKIKTAKHVFEFYSDGDLSFEDFMLLSQQNCFYCGGEPSNCYNWYVYKKSGFTDFRKENGYFTYNGLDRIDNSRPHDKNNVVPCCANCNRARLARTQQNFIEWIQKTYHHLRGKGLL